MSDFEIFSLIFDIIGLLLLFYSVTKSKNNRRIDLADLQRLILILILEACNRLAVTHEKSE